MADKKLDIYQIITDRMIDRILTESKLPWTMPWKSYGSDGGYPRSLISKKPYRGINVWLLSNSIYSAPYWLTYKQAAQLKGTVRKGEKGTPVVYWHWFEKKGALGQEERIPVLKYYTVFNVEQCDGVEYPKPEQVPVNDGGSIEAAERILNNMPNKPEITFNEARAYYSPANDRVNMPKKESFRSIPEFYSIFFHELTHSTGHSSRCGRMKTLNDWNRFGSDPYAKEELVAEMGASFLCGVAGIQAEVEDTSVAYLQGWVEKLKNDKKLLVQASAQAQKAADFILGNKAESEEHVATTGSDND
jgi:antirestriction protein ArdC